MSPVGHEEPPDAAPRSSQPMLLDQDGVGHYLLARGVGREPYTDAETLAGGVSNVVVRVRTDGRQVVVKQSLETLAVADPWTAPTRRVITEARVMSLLGSLTPGRVPKIIDQDEVRHTIVMQSAPEGWVDWKSQLMAGEVDGNVARVLGGVLATWHQRTSSPSGLLEPRLDEYEAFEALRVDPYFRTAAARAPEVSSALLSLVRDMESRRSCLVHGDFSPKNVLVGPADQAARDRAAATRLWVIDFEVAHRGDPAFDAGFMCSHLLMKSCALPEIAGQLDAALDAFLAAYSGARPALEGAAGDRPSPSAALEAGPGPEWPHLSRVVGALLVARIKGKSPAGYLHERARRHVWELGVSLLREPVASAQEVTDRRNAYGA